MPFTPQRLAALEITLSAERLNGWQELVKHQNLAPWRARARIQMPSDREAAIRLHQWNMALSMAFMSSIQVFELALRNKMHDALRAHAGRDDWWDPVQNKLMPDQQDKLEEAKRKLQLTKRPATPGRIMSELSLGFWVSLTGPGYDNPRDSDRNYWRTCLSEVFRPPAANAPRRPELNTGLNKIRLLRNNVAHHEPIVCKDLGAEYACLLSETRKLCFDTADWLEETSLVPGLLNADWLKALGAAGRLVGSH